MGRKLLKFKPWTATAATHAHTYTGETVTAAAPYHPRDGAKLDDFNGKYWMYGGWHPDDTAPWHPATTTNEVWWSLDLITWTLALAHDADPPTSGAGARWRGRHTFPRCKFNGAIWVLGGDLNDDYRSDVWRSTDPGDADGWVRIAASSPWGPKYDPIPAVYDGAMHVMGGYDSNGDATREHWRTTDGVEWERLPDMPFARAGATEGVVIAGRLHIVGGASGRYGVDNVFCNDTWAWNGTRWRQMSASAIWDAGYWITVCVYDDRLWVACRADDIAGNMGGLFWSDDCGATWNDASADAPWAVSHADAYCVTEQDGIVVASGNNHGTNVYRVKVAA
jgi:hypothetical protein